jgi:hypothetical protein
MLSASMIGRQASEIPKKGLAETRGYAKMCPMRRTLLTSVFSFYFSYGRYRNVIVDII